MVYGRLQMTAVLTSAPVSPRARPRFAWLPLDGALSLAVQRKLVDSLYQQLRTLLAGAVAMVFLAGVLWHLTGNPIWFGSLLWAAGVTAWRWYDTILYRRKAQGRTPLEWARRFTIASWASALWWGTGCMLVLTTTDNSIAQLILIAVQAGYLGGATIRNAASPAAAQGQVYLILGPLLVGAELSGELHLMLFGIFVVIHIVASIELVRYLSNSTMRLLVADERLEMLAVTDSLTSLSNRRAFDDALTAEWRRAARSGRPLSLLMLDIDHFKRFNDSFGHQAGDECLRSVAAAIRANVRQAVDTPARYGGEEFAVILPYTDEVGALGVAEKLRAAVEALGIARASRDKAPVTVSLGVATAHPNGQGEPALLVATADKALYAAKAAGRNRAMAASVAGGVP
jgi:diguanylate cyclase (GGDEF)-like protein